MPRHYSQTIEIKAAPAQVWMAIAEVTRWGGMDAEQFAYRAALARVHEFRQKQAKN